MLKQLILCVTYLYSQDELTGEWRKLCSEELYNLYSPPNIIRHIKSRRMRWAVHVERMGKESVQSFDWKARRKKKLGRSRRRCEDGIKMDLREIGWGCRMDPAGSV
jgi:hypothetical protein